MTNGIFTLLQIEKHPWLGLHISYSRLFQSNFSIILLPMKPFEKHGEAWRLLKIFANQRLRHGNQNLGYLARACLTTVVPFDFKCKLTTSLAGNTRQMCHVSSCQLKFQCFSMRKIQEGRIRCGLGFGFSSSTNRQLVGWSIRVHR